MECFFSPTSKFLKKKLCGYKKMFLPSLVAITTNKGVGWENCTKTKPVDQTVSQSIRQRASQQNREATRYSAGKQSVQRRTGANRPPWMLARELGREGLWIQLLIQFFLLNVRLQFMHVIRPFPLINSWLPCSVYFYSYSEGGWFAKPYRLKVLRVVPPSPSYKFPAILFSLFSLVILNLGLRKANNNF